MESWMSGILPLEDDDLRPPLCLAMALERASMGLLMLWDTSSSTLRPAIAEGLAPEQVRLFDHQRAGLGAVGIAYVERKRVTIHDATRDEDDRARLIRHIARRVGFCGVEVLPLTPRGSGVLGAIVMLFRAPLTVDERLAALTTQCGGLVAFALENARLRVKEEQARRMAEAIAEERVQFVARVSHEMRTPLQSITGYLELLRTGTADCPTPQQRALLERVERSERVLIGVVDDLTHLGRLEAGHIDLRMQPVNAHEVISTAESVMAPIAVQLHVALEVDKPEREAGVIAHADARKASQVLINLLTNALKFTPPGGNVRLSCRTEGHNVVFDVTDSGPGIAPDKLNRIFEPYVQLGTHVRHGFDGLGLGLAISREFAHAMGGSLTATSIPGQGATFTFSVRHHRPERPVWRHRAREEHHETVDAR